MRDTLRGFDYIIVGGGSAGCVLANRLSARSTNKVLLCEAGQDTPPGAVPADILDSYSGVAYLNRQYQWAGLGIEPTRFLTHRGPQMSAWKKYEQARVLGGGSSINGLVALRGLPTDYDAWENLGARGWRWENVLPYFVRCENDRDYSGPFHGSEGPISITRLAQSQWTGHAQAFARAFAESGYPLIEDQNAMFGDGYCTLPGTVSGTQRVSTAIAYLDHKVRSRPNLTIVTDTLVTGLTFDGRRCVGVQAQTSGQQRQWSAAEVIVASGAIHTPAHLLRAGIGPAEELRALSIEVRYDAPGVGKRMMDHPLAAIAGFLPPEFRMRRADRRHLQLSLRFSSRLPGAPCGDMAVFVGSKSAWHAVGKQIGATLLSIYSPYSQSGEVKLKSSDPSTPPSVTLNLLADDRDLKRMIDGYRWLARLYTSEAVSGCVRNPFPAVWSQRKNSIGGVNVRNRLKAELAARMLDGPPWLSDRMMKKFVIGDLRLADVLESDESLAHYLKQSVSSAYHVSGSCRMGRIDDPLSVTDEQGLVHGIGGLRIVDASIFPSIPAANTNLPVIMVAERISDLILKGTTADRGAVETLAPAALA